ncbi:PDR/VanB family oxidoreductase [Nocardia farcinica]|uniref:PDR/VanB family oxidoreductase n=1 Tax=Nocardia farcinica TaxID=37329 RepID=UPI0024553DE3|nr:PDR/VanB family oxidoreductase [Nocardia farcinica]
MTTGYRPGAGIRLIVSATDAYKRLFVQSPAAPLLSRPQPVRRTGYDLPVVVERIETVAEDVVAVTLRHPAGTQLPAWTPGAHLDVFLPSGTQRQYSINGDPADRRRYRIAVRRIADGGGGSREIHDTVRIGDRLRIRGPRNAFDFVAAPRYLFLAGGIGITPILPMVRAARAAGRDTRLVYTGRSLASMPFRAELAAVPGADIDIRPDDEYGQPDVAAIVRTALPGTAVYVCGPPPMLAAAVRAVGDDPSVSLHTERFSPPPVAGGAEFAITLARSGTQVRVGAEETALAAIRRVLPGVAYSCRQGYCGTCKVRVLAGQVDHRDRALSAAERAESMLTCVSRAADGDLVLDL